MIPALILLSVLAAVGLVLYLWDRHTLRHMPPASEGTDENTPAPGVQTDGWRLDSAHVLDGARLVRDPMPEKWDWPGKSGQCRMPNEELRKRPDRASLPAFCRRHPQGASRRRRG